MLAFFDQLLVDDIEVVGRKYVAFHNGVNIVILRVYMNNKSLKIPWFYLRPVIRGKNI